MSRAPFQLAPAYRPFAETAFREHLNAIFRCAVTKVEGPGVVVTRRLEQLEPGTSPFAPGFLALLRARFAEGLTFVGGDASCDGEAASKRNQMEEILPGMTWDEVVDVIQGNLARWVADIQLEGAGHITAPTPDTRMVTAAGEDDDGDDDEQDDDADDDGDDSANSPSPGNPAGDWNWNWRYPDDEPTAPPGEVTCPDGTEFAVEYDITYRLYDCGVEDLWSDRTERLVRDSSDENVWYGSHALLFLENPGSSDPCEWSVGVAGLRLTGDATRTGTPTGSYEDAPECDPDNPGEDRIMNVSIEEVVPA